jgi:hypothetical protein
MKAQHHSFWTTIITMAIVSIFCFSCGPKPCTEGSCPDGQVCWTNGYCSPEVPAESGPGQAPPDVEVECDLPQLLCNSDIEDCAELIQFDPTYGYGYSDFPENGETEDNQYRSWLRRDTVYLIKYATARVACLSKNWSYGNGGPLGLIDMSEEDGSIPGTSIGSPGHPAGTHTNGYDIDVAYYQKDSDDNRARVICDDRDFHCQDFPHLMDEWRNALFLGSLYEHPDLRVVGVDGKAGGMIEQAFEMLCEWGWIKEEACQTHKFAYEFVDEGRGFYRFHHHHMHISFNGTSQGYAAARSDMNDESLCITKDCNREAIDEFYANSCQ